MAIRFGFCANPHEYVIVMVMVREQDSQIPNPGIQVVSLPVDPVQARQRKGYGFRPHVGHS